MNPAVMESTTASWHLEQASDGPASGVICGGLSAGKGQERAMPAASRACIFSRISGWPLARTTVMVMTMIGHPPEPSRQGCQHHCFRRGSYLAETL